MVYKYKRKVYQQTLLDLTSFEGRSIGNPFFYVKFCHDIDTIKGQHCSDKDNEKGQVSE
jgi:hypothetical protein